MGDAVLLQLLSLIHISNKEKATVLFYVTPTSSGEFSVTCSLEFTPAGTDEKVTQPLGSGFFLSLIPI